MEAKEASQKVWSMVVNGAKTDQSILHAKIDAFLQKECPKADYKNLLRRKDNRLWQQFFCDIKTSTNEESATRDKWINDVKNRGHVVKFQDKGIDNQGYPVLWGMKGTADYEFTIDKNKPILVDIKNNPRTHAYMTFKVIDLIRYAKNNVSMLICMGDFWVMLGPRFIEGLLVDWPREVFGGFAGGKKAIRLTKAQFMLLESLGYFHYYLWGDKKKFIGPDNKKITFSLFAEKIKPQENDQYKNIVF